MGADAGYIKELALVHRRHNKPVYHLNMSTAKLGKIAPFPPLPGQPYPPARNHARWRGVYIVCVVRLDSVG